MPDILCKAGSFTNHQFHEYMYTTEEGRGFYLFHSVPGYYFSFFFFSNAP